MRRTIRTHRTKGRGTLVTSAIAFPFVSSYSVRFESKVRTNGCVCRRAKIFLAPLILLLIPFFFFCSRHPSFPASSETVPWSCLKSSPECSRTRACFPLTRRRCSRRSGRGRMAGLRNCKSLFKVLVVVCRHSGSVTKWSSTDGRGYNRGEEL